MANEIPEKTNEVSFRELIHSLRDLFHYLLSKWIVILLFIIAGGILGLVFSVRSKVTYLANCTFVLEEESGSGGGIGQLAGLASMVGLDLGGGGGGVFQGENLLELYRSRMMITKTLLSTYMIDGKPTMLVDRYIKFNQLKETVWENNPRLKQVNFIPGKDGKMSRLLDSLLTDFATQIDKDTLRLLNRIKN